MLGIAPLGGHPLGGFAFLSSGYVLTANAGAYTLTGSPASLKVGRLLRAYDNLVLNGQFTLDTSNWTVSGSDTTFISANKQGELALGPAASGGFAYQAISVVPGKRYNLSAFLKPSGYYMSADPGSYVMTGTDAALTYGTASPAISDQSLSDTRSGFAAGLGITIKGDGFVYWADHTGEMLLERWLPAGLDVTHYAVRATHISGSAGSGAFLSWLHFTSTASQFNWGLTQSSLGTISTLVELELGLDNGSGGYTVIDSAMITMTATRT